MINTKSSNADNDLKLEASHPDTVTSTTATTSGNTEHCNINSDEQKYRSNAASNGNSSNKKQHEPTVVQSTAPSQQIANTKMQPVPRARPRSRIFKADAVTSTETSTNPDTVVPLPIYDQTSVLPNPIVRSNTIGHTGLAETVHNAEDNATAVMITGDHQKPEELDLQRVEFPAIKERQRSQTFPRKPRRNLPEDTGGPTNELQALLARRRKWEQTDTK